MIREDHYRDLSLNIPDCCFLVFNIVLIIWSRGHPMTHSAESPVYFEMISSMRALSNWLLAQS